MLTRIEIDGFKSFEDFALDLSPFTVVLGPNAAGKSNLFDAIQLLSKLAVLDLRSAAREMRGEAYELFRQNAPEHRVDSMRFAVEVLLQPRVRDPWGKEVALTHTRVRYELEVTRVKNERGIERLLVTHEAMLPITGFKRDRWRPFGGQYSTAFRDAFVRYPRRTPWLSSEVSDQEASFKIHQDGSQGRTRPGHAAESTVLSSMTTADFPHLYALREELRSWRLLQLDPAGLRRPSPLDSDEALVPDGSNLAAVLHRILAETREESRPHGMLADIAAELATVIPGVLDVDVELNEAAREYRAWLRLRDGFEFPTAVVSDGTLRVLALLTLLYDPEHRGVVCFEEPENGIHPARLGTLLHRLRELVTDPTAEDVDSEQPLTQLLMNSHSPVVLAALRQENLEGALFFADAVAVAEPTQRTVRRKTRIRPVVPQAESFERQDQVSDFEVRRYLEAVNQGA
jgi:predicted ATPase